MTTNYKKPNNKKGITLFIAVVVSGVLLFIGFAMVNIAIKGTLFASSGRESQIAFYLADSGLECALYWDSKYRYNPSEPRISDSAFATSSYSGETLPRTIYCAGSGIAGTGQALYGTTTLGRIGLGGNANPTSVFSFLMTPGDESGPCAVVTVEKRYTGSYLGTYIKSRGYNSCDINNPRRVERGVEVNY